MNWDKLELQILSIVLVGDFNPKIYQPEWFVSKNLITRSEADDVNIEILRHDINFFALGGWLRMEVLPERFLVRTLQEAYFERLRDLVIATFKLLEYTPIRMMGINISAHFPITTEEWSKVEFGITSTSLWGKFLSHPQLHQVTIEEPKSNGYVRITLNHSNGKLVIDINDHYEISDKRACSGCGEIITLLQTQWDESRKRSKEIVESILKEIK